MSGLVCVIDDDEAVRDSVAFLLQSDGWNVQTFASAEAFLFARPEGCRCVVTDVRMPGLDGVSLTRRLRDERYAAPVIVMTGHGDVPLAVAAMKEGAADFLQKPFGDEAMLAAVRAAAASGAHTAGADDDDARARFDQLSPREREVLEGLVGGKANKVIANELGISPRTVEIYRANVMTKMEAGSFAELVRMAVRAGVAADSGAGRLR
jgi:two-component system response regulator FixJ